jgi:hypothetical protein
MNKTENGRFLFRPTFDVMELENEMGGACGAYGAGERGVQGYGGET